MRPSDRHRRTARHTGLMPAWGTCLLAGFGPLLALVTTAPQPANFYVAVAGNDGWSGRLPVPNDAGTDGPFATLARARDAVRAARQADGGTLKQPATVILRGGYYELPEALRLTPADSGTEACPVTWRAAEGEQVTLSGGRRIATAWHTDDGKVFSTTIPEARGHAWRFRQLFVDSVREPLARYPNLVRPDPDGDSYLYAGGKRANAILVGLARRGDFVEYAFDAPAAGAYSLWIGVATPVKEVQKFLAISVDGKALDAPSPIQPSADFRTVQFSRAGQFSLGAGRHRLRVENTSASGERRIHLDALVLTTNPRFSATGGDLAGAIPGEQRVVIQAEDDAARVDGHSSIGFQKITIGSGLKPDRTTLRTDANRVKASWANDPEAMVDVIADLHYFNELVQIDSVDAASGTVHVKGAEAKHLLRPGNAFFVSGVREELDAPGEWYLDSATGRLDYWPRPGHDPNRSRVVAPRLDRLIELAGDAEGTERVRWVRFKGITFEHCAGALEHVAMRTVTDAAVRLDCAWDCSIEDCTFRHVDGFAVWLHMDSCQNTITGNTMEDLGAGGVMLTGARLGYGEVFDARPAVADYAPLRNVLTRNHIHDGGRVRVCAAGFLLDSRPESTAHRAGNLIAFNHVHHMTRQGVFGFANQGGNVVAYNHFHHLVQATADAGAINFAVMNNVAAPNLIHHNLVHDIAGLVRASTTEPQFFCGIGIYLDWGTSNNRAHDNAVFNTHYGSSLINGGQLNVLENNVFLADSGANLHLGFEPITRDNVLRHNVLAQPKIPAAAIHWATAWRPPPATGQASAPPPLSPIQSDFNLLWNAGKPPTFTPLGDWEQWRADGMDAHSVVADPALDLPLAPGVIELRDAAVARAIGLRPIDLRQIGPDGRVAEPPSLDGLDLAILRMEVASARAGQSTRVTLIPKLPKPGRYHVYCRRTSRGKPLADFGITISHANGELTTAYSKWLPPGANPLPPWSTYLGTYEFDGKAGQGVTLTPARADAPLPEQVIFLGAFGG